ncbi:hypothetical protein C1I63_02920 [Rathayibacter caricis DSM 15933]|uniref:Cell wall-binding repeat-containing protein n=1 Tax=Rathayibacter caricis DSM 15933 TaxID=1328867 RepID=A0A2T4UQV4_9MICO|nr:cell wall-binding repeat-containing protein [Rathayibacter caricis]PTL71893.1 hypothetical protein C1I63_02920 [Rathayibacter caricis DSM 15933]
MHTPRRRLLPLSCVGVAAVLLAGLAAGPAAADPLAPVSPAAPADSSRDLASLVAGSAEREGAVPLSPVKTQRQTVDATATADEVVLSGRIVLSGADDANPAPTGDAYFLRIEDDRGGIVAEVTTAADFSVSLPAGTNYYLQASVPGSTAWYPTWFGDTPIGVEADALAKDRDDLVITLPRTAAASGGVFTPAGAADPTSWVVQAYWFEEDAGTLYPFDETATSSAPNTWADWSLSGEDALPLGEYVFRVTQPGYPAFDDQYFSNLPYVQPKAITTLPAAGLSGVDFRPTGFATETDRVFGSDRYATSAATTQLAFGDDGTLPVLYIASGEKWPDALSAGPAASVQGGALLLTDPNRVPAVISAEIERLNPERIVVVGSSLSVSDQVFQTLQRTSGADVERIAGTDRYDTSRRIVADAFGDDSYGIVFLATGSNFPDALSVAPIAGRLGQPVLLVDGAKSALDAPTRTAIDRLQPDLGELLGGTPSISAGVEGDLATSGLVTEVGRVAGVDRHDTSRQLNDRYPSNELNDTAFLATATGFADALSIGAVAAAYGAPLYLSEPNCVPYATRVALQANELDYVLLLGGPTTLQPAIDSLAVC